MTSYLRTWPAIHDIQTRPGQTVFLECDVVNVVPYNDDIDRAFSYWQL